MVQNAGVTNDVGSKNKHMIIQPSEIQVIVYQWAHKNDEMLDSVEEQS